MKDSNFKSIISHSKNSTDAFLGNILLLISALVFIIILGFCIIPEQYFRIDKELGSLVNTMSFLSFIFTGLALVVAIFAYNKSVLKPKLTLEVIPLQQVDTQVKVRVDADNIILGRPLNEWSLVLHNGGEISAKYPMVRMKFEFDAFRRGYFREDAFQKWEAISHAHGNGYYEFQWSPDITTILYPGFSIKLPKVYFGGNRFEKDFVVSFTYVADGVEATTVRIPVNVEHIENLKRGYNDTETK